MTQTNINNKIKKIISDAIKETHFYKDLKDAISWWYHYDDRNSMIILGGHGIGKSTTVRAILDENFRYIEFNSDRLETAKDVDVEQIKKAINKEDIILLDDVKITKRSMYNLLKLWEAGYNILIICNNEDEVINADKLYNKSYIYRAFLLKEDLDLLKERIAKTLGITFPENAVILNIRDLISVTKYVLDEPKKSSLRLTVDEIIEKTKNIGIQNKRVLAVLSLIREKTGYLDESIVMEVLTKKFGYSTSYAKKKVPKIIRFLEAWKLGGKWNAI